MKIYSLTDKGLSRKDNQDNYWSAILSVNDEEAGVVCICDGMGGLNNGRLASKMVVEAVRNYLLTNFDFSGLTDVLSKVNNEILSLSNGVKEKLMGTTCTLLVCYKGCYKILHIGDSRAYMLRDNIPSLLTVDHSAVKMYNISKKDNPQLWNKYKSKLTKCIGVKPILEPYYCEGDYLKGDMFFLCSDGCWHYFDDYTLNEDSINDLEALFKKCMSNGETDNLTAGILYI